VFDEIASQGITVPIPSNQPYGSLGRERTISAQIPLPSLNMEIYANRSCMPNVYSVERKMIGRSLQM